MNQDSIVLSVVNKFKSRSDIGIEKYGVTLDREDLSPTDWINHAQEEAMDLTLYLERLRKEKLINDELIELCHEFIKMPANSFKMNDLQERMKFILNR